MKKIFKFAMLFAAACMMTMGTVSCSSDDDNNDNVDVTKEQNEAIEALTKQ